MLCKLLLVAALAASVGLFAQSQPAYTPSNQSAGMPQPTAPTVVVAPSSPSIYVLAGGIYGTGVYVQTPGTLPLQSTGIALAGREGLSLETPLQTGFVTALSSLIPGAIIYGTPAFTGMPEATLGEAGRPMNDLGPSYYVGATEAARPARSLGEVSAEYKKGHPRAVKLYTNADAERLAKP
jgi:hypothetical protein